MRTINEILSVWYGKCHAAGVYPFEMIFRKFALNVEESLNDRFLDGIFPSRGWLETWKSRYGIRKTLITGEPNGIPATTKEAWIERIPEVIKFYELKNIWKMDESDLFFKLLPEIGLIEKSNILKQISQRL